MFGDERDPTWKFYGLAEMRSETEAWRDETDPVWVRSDVIDPHTSVLVGELGYDRPFALDYRNEPPVVRFLTIAGRCVDVADSAAAFLFRLSGSRTTRR